jgi:hypothetical protein
MQRKDIYVNVDVDASLATSVGRGSFGVVPMHIKGSTIINLVHLPLSIG